MKFSWNFYSTPQKAFQLFIIIVVHIFDKMGNLLSIPLCDCHCHIHAEGKQQTVVSNSPAATAESSESPQPADNDLHLQELTQSAEILQPVIADLQHGSPTSRPRIKRIKFKSSDEVQVFYKDDPPIMVSVQQHQMMHSMATKRSAPVRFSPRKSKTRGVVKKSKSKKAKHTKNRKSAK